MPSTLSLIRCFFDPLITHHKWTTLCQRSLLYKSSLLYRGLILFWIGWGVGLVQEIHAQTRIDLAGEGGYFCQGNQDQTRTHGGYGGVEIQYPFGSAWEVHTGYSQTQLTQNRSAHRLHFGVRYRLDIFTYVPWVGLNGYLTPSSTWPTSLSPPQDAEEDTDNTEEITLTPLDEMTPNSSSSTPLDGWGNQSGIFFEVGLDRYLHRDWRAGVIFRFQALPFLDSVPIATTLGLHLTYQWTLFDPFED